MVKNILTVLLFLLFAHNVHSQNNFEFFNTSKEQKLKPVWDTIYPNAFDFTVISTDGDTLNLYTALDSGKTIVLDFFFKNCTYCILYAPIIEEIYQNTGAGSQNIDFWGIDFHDTNQEVIDYKQAHGVSNPCASGLEGNADSVIYKATEEYGLSGFPTYAVICPDRKVFWEINCPPVDTGFNQYFNDCGAIPGIKEMNINHSATINKIYPVPASSFINVEFFNREKSDVRFDIVNLSGEYILSFYFDKINEDICTKKLSLENLPPGNYFVKLTIDNVIKDTRIITVIK